MLPLLYKESTSLTVFVHACTQNHTLLLPEGYLRPSLFTAHVYSDTYTPGLQILIKSLCV